jgi:hypothetical protein
MFGPVNLHAKIAFTCNTRRKPTHCRGDSGIAAQASAEAATVS